MINVPHFKVPRAIDPLIVMDRRDAVARLYIGDAFTDGQNFAGIVCAHNPLAGRRSHGGAGCPDLKVTRIWTGRTHFHEDFTGAGRRIGTVYRRQLFGVDVVSNDVRLHVGCFLP